MFAILAFFHNWWISWFGIYDKPTASSSLEMPKVIKRILIKKIPDQNCVDLIYKFIGFSNIRYVDRIETTKPILSLGEYPIDYEIFEAEDDDKPTILISGSDKLYSWKDKVVQNNLKFVFFPRPKFKVTKDYIIMINKEPKNHVEILSDNGLNSTTRHSKSKIHSACMMKDGTSAIGCEDGSVSVKKYFTDILKFDAHKSPVTHLESLDITIISGSEGSLKWWELDKCVGEFETDDVLTSLIAFNGTDKFEYHTVVAGYQDGIIRVFDFMRRCIYKMKHPGTVNAMIYYKDHIISGGEDRIAMWYKEQCVQIFHCDSPVLCFAAFEDRLVSGHHDGSIRFYKKIDL